MRRGWGSVLVAAVSVIGADAVAQSTPNSAPIVFVCEHGSVKSVVAATIFNEVAAQRGLPFRAISRGTDPDAGTPATVVQGMEAEGLPVDASFRPAPLVPADVTGASKVVVFDVALPPDGNVQRWDKLPAFSDGYDPASAAIRKRVEALLTELTKQ